MEEIKIELIGTHNLGERKERTEKFVLEIPDKSDVPCILLRNSEGKIVLSFNPFHNGGSLWIGDFNYLILDVENWAEDENGKFKLKSTENITTSTAEINRWKEDSEKLACIREAKNILFSEVEENGNTSD